MEGKAQKSRSFALRCEKRVNFSYVPISVRMYECVCMYVHMYAPMEKPSVVVHNSVFIEALKWNIFRMPFTNPLF